MDEQSNGTARLASAGMKLIRSLADALLAWTAVPPSIIQTAGRPEAQTRTQRLLERSARKFCDDFGAAVVLLRSGFVGPSHAVLRMCRENIGSMLFLALADQSEAERFIRFATEQKPADTRLKLHRRVKKILEELGDSLPTAARARLSAAILDENQCRADETIATQDKKASIQADYFDQLLGYFILARHARRANRSFPLINRLALYFARHGYLWTWDVSALHDDREFLTIEQWFVDEAEGRHADGTACDMCPIPGEGKNCARYFALDLPQLPQLADPRIS